MSKVKISTSFGDITVRLYDETPLHRDNFLKLAKKGFYDGTLFHRIIKDFMIQGGDPDSRKASKDQRLGSGDAGYTIPAEFNPALFHKRGALSAARLGDNVNPERRSSGCQFYIVWGKTYGAGQIAQLEKQLFMQAQEAEFNALVMKNRDKVMDMRRKRDQEGLMALQNEFIAESEAAVRTKGLGKMSEEAKTVYTTVGGTPFLDGQYTVFGEVESGLEIVGKIQECATNSDDRPLEDIRMTVSVIE